MALETRLDLAVPGIQADHGASPSRLPLADPPPSPVHAPEANRFPDPSRAPSFFEAGSRPTRSLSRKPAGASPTSRIPYPRTKNRPCANGWGLSLNPAVFETET